MALQSSSSASTFLSLHSVSTSLAHASSKSLPDRVSSPQDPASSVRLITSTHMSSGHTLMVRPPNRLRTRFSSRSVVSSREVIPTTQRPGV